ncbi:hypothetical protein VB780_08230 [Leptolyngbya sp. CCNP1308]|uniref:hypothetical protein n=1 Tax=Leptolyngbya sp. CCNP1308 TaxID=3110255 RepID=UPI002B20D3F3|nr:hypothetical protein [Leptolyngbya sp. CCNP1308]MEA5448547.1 hypothetical protein [Leptolyngbya sp. CCNP1308]
MSTTGDKAKRATVAIGTLSVDGFQMPDGSYRMSITGAAESVSLTVSNASDFLRSKAIKALLGNDSTPRISEVEVESNDQLTGQTRIRALPLDVVIVYWNWQSHRGNKQALQLCIALATETLERRFDAAFGVERSESDRDALLTQRLQSDLSALGEAYAEPDDLREQVARLEQQLRDAGLEPWQLPQSER